MTTSTAARNARNSGCGSLAPLIAEVKGRADDAFVYAGGVATHPLVLRTPLGQHPMIEEYQVHQTPEGAAIKIVARGEVDLARLELDLVAALKGQGLADPKITLEIVKALERHKETGKLKRFIPLS